MLSWISANLVNIALTALIALGVGLAVRRLLRDKKAGKSACGGNCASCGLCGGCGGGKNAGNLPRRPQAGPGGGTGKTEAAVRQLQNLRGKSAPGEKIPVSPRKKLDNHPSPIYIVKS